MGTDDARERVARAILTLGRIDQDGLTVAQQVEREWADPEQRELSLDQADAALTAIAEAPGLAEVLGRALREHQPTTGMSVAMGVTCRCGYWNGDEDGGKTRPVGYQGLQWHQANVQADVVREWLRGQA